MSLKLNEKISREWYTDDIKDVFSYFKSGKNGLQDYQISENSKNYGKNILNEQKVPSYFEIFISQFKSPLIYVLIISAIVVFYLKDYVDAYIILTIVIINAVIGAIQEGKAQNTLGALKKVVKSYATVLRNGSQKRIPDYEIVAGDIIILKDGDLIPADARIFESNSLKVNESSLTGESNTVLKHENKIQSINLIYSDQKNMLFKGTYVISGLAKAIVVRVGSSTVIGKIANKLSELHVNVPLKKNIDNLSKLLVISVLLISLFLYFLGINTGKSGTEMFITVVALSVSAIPEGLPVVVTVVLASGVWRMSKIKVLVKKLQAVEALGQAKVLALDKTGTITKNQMMIEKIFVNDRYLDVTGVGYNPTGRILENKNEVDFKKDVDLDLILKISAFTSIAKIVHNQQDNSWNLELGDPTEASLLVLVKKMGKEKDELLHEYPQVIEFPFDIKNKHHSAINVIGKKEFLSSAGSPELILSKCKYVWSQGKNKKIDEIEVAKIHEVMREFASQGYRILALACDFDPNKNITAENIKDLTFVGLVAISDAIRPEVYDSVKKVKDAGIKPIMITGDYKETATAIAKRVGIFEEGDEVILGNELMELSDESLIDKLDKVSVFARVSPEDKMRIIELYKKTGQIIAMTGDGVNDALSLTSANLGVSMGKVGTEVAKEASDIILLDDNFGNIVQAAEEGRNIYLTIKKAILYLLATNLGEILVITTAVIAGLPLPIIASQIIWLNLVTDASLVIMLSFEPKEKNLLKEKYYKPSKYIIDLNLFIKIIPISFLMLALTMFIFSKFLGQDMVKVWTMCLTMLTVIKWYHILNVRSDKETIFSKKIFNNKYIFFGLLIAISLHVFAIYTPFMNSILKITPLNMSDWLLLLSLGFIVVLLEELRKYFIRREFSV